MPELTDQQQAAIDKELERVRETKTRQLIRSSILEVVAKRWPRATKGSEHGRLKQLLQQLHLTLSFYETREQESAALYKTLATTFNQTAGRLDALYKQAELAGKTDVK